MEQIAKKGLMSNHHCTFHHLLYCTPTEAKTRTVSNDSSFPIFDESFEFQINLPELALVRFVVLDDDFIGDDFVGQCTIPLDCIQTGGWCAFCL